jgi:CRISPR-associated endonuclease Csn1
MQTKQFDWYLGLDIGSNSVGYSATNTEYTILTKGKKLQCGARLFEDAQDASERRAFRSSRRRFARRKVRVDLLQSLFDSAITAVDQSFFIRMNSSSRYEVDNTGKISDTYPLFTDTNFTDRDYYAKFPTIYHLRKHLLENDEHDPRLLYLACHHLIKYRGHFLFENFNASDNNSGYAEIYKALKVQNQDELENNNKSAANAIKGNKIDLVKLFPEDIEMKEKLEPIKDDLKEYKFSSEQFDECHMKAGEILSNDQNEYILTLKQLYDRIRLDKILKGERNVAMAMVTRYDEHKADLKTLKNFIKQQLPGEYNGVFRKNGLYSNFVGLNNTHRRETISHSLMCKTDTTTISHENFIKGIMAILEKASDKTKQREDYIDLKSRIDNVLKPKNDKNDERSFCQNHNTKDNASIPYQLQLAELVEIFEKQKKNFLFLQQRDEYGTVADKIKSLLTFRIPYYVGPLTDKFNGEKFAWIIRQPGQENSRILPWNFDNVVDLAASGEQFITRMTAKCTYLKTEDVIPQQSLLYQKYMLLQDLNNLKISNNRISQDLKMFLFNGICQNETSLTKKKIKDYLVLGGKIQKIDTVGKEDENDTAFNSSLSSLIKFQQILGSNTNFADDKTVEMCENIIKWHTVFGDEKKPVDGKIRSMYGNILTEEQIIKLGKLSFRGWGRFSAKFLNGITTNDKSTGETALTIIKLLEGTTLNLMEILNSDRYNPMFTATVTNINKSDDTQSVTYDMVEDMYCSPIVKRSIWQAILISKELTKINGQPPKKVFIEVTRSKDKSKKGKMIASRRKQLEGILNKAAKDCKEVSTLLEKLNDKTDAELRSDRLYLYFTQLGKCMYTGKKIDLAQLSDNNLYDLDHIYPKSRIKDDSLTNRVLVCRLRNANKSADYPLAKDIQELMKSFWDMLLAKNLINREKYSRLTATHHLTAEQIGAFINRQLVATNQAVKETANTLKILFGDNTQIVYSKAGNVSEFRRMFDLVKCREVNNLHHAHDAYLNIVVGNEWSVKYTDKWFSEPNTGDEKLLVRLFPQKWADDYLPKIKGYLFDNKKYLGKFPVTVRTYEVKGAFYKQTIHPKTSADLKSMAEFSLHESDGGDAVKKYGGYNYGYNTYNCLIEYDNKKKQRVRGIFFVPIRFAKRYTCDALLAELGKLHKLTNPKLLISKIPMFSVLEVDGVRYFMRSGDLQCSNVNEWYPDKDKIAYVHDICKYLALVKEKQLTPDKETTKDIQFASRERNPKAKEGKIISRDKNVSLYDTIITQLQKPFYKELRPKKDLSRTKFVELTTHVQAEILERMLKYLSCGLITVGDLTPIGATKTENAKCKFNGIDGHNVYLITQSVTGLFEKRITLNEIKKD